MKASPATHEAPAVCPAPCPPARPVEQRFTRDGSDALENHLARICDQVLAELRSRLPPDQVEAVLLGGGYGRGEGGVLRTPAGDQPYNDLEFYVFVRGNRWRQERRYGPILRALAEALTPAAGVEVEFKLITFAQLRHSPGSMFYYDLLMGHRWLGGDEQLLAGCEHLQAASLIPLAEAARLLMNRCSGLLFAREQLERELFTPENADFVGRNLAKAQLALGDVVLTVFGRYHWSCQERHRRLQEMELDLPWLPLVRQHHALGAAFKLHPRYSTAPRASLMTQHEELSALALRVWLWLECRRLGHPFVSACDYAQSRLDKCPETSGWRNLLVNFKTFGAAAADPNRLLRYPRERLFHALALLLWSPQTLIDPALLRQVQRELRTRAESFADLVGAYQALWRRFN